jgi:hypothetical protein
VDIIKDTIKVVTTREVMGKVVIIKVVIIKVDTIQDITKAIIKDMGQIQTTIIMVIKAIMLMEEVILMMELVSRLVVLHVLLCFAVAVFVT